MPVKFISERYDHSSIQSRRYKTSRDLAVTSYRLVNRSPQWATVLSSWDVMTLKRLPLYWPFVRGIHRWFSAHKQPVMRKMRRFVFFIFSLNKLFNKHFDNAMIWGQFHSCDGYEALSRLHIVCSRLHPSFPFSLSYMVYVTHSGLNKMAAIVPKTSWNRWLRARLQ